MDSQEPPSISSFVIRFVYSELSLIDGLQGQAKHAYRGTIRHVQSDQEIAFVEWEVAQDFMRQFVPLEIDV